MTLAPTREVRTPIGDVSLHQVALSFFFGFDVVAATDVKLASPEKALLDVLYLRPARSRRFRALPELERKRTTESRAGRWEEASATHTHRGRMPKRNQKQQRSRRQRGESPRSGRLPFTSFATRVGEQCIVTTPAVSPSPWTRRTYDLIHEYQQALARTGRDEARESAGAAFIVIASDILQESLGSLASWERLDVEAVAQRAAMALPHLRVRDQCRANLRDFARFLADTGRISRSAMARLASEDYAATHPAGG